MLAALDPEVKAEETVTVEASEGNPETIQRFKVQKPHLLLKNSTTTLFQQMLKINVENLLFNNVIKINFPLTQAIAPEEAAKVTEVNFAADAETVKAVQEAENAVGVILTHEGEEEIETPCLLSANEDGTLKTNVAGETLAQMVADTETEIVILTEEKAE